MTVTEENDKELDEYLLKHDIPSYNILRYKSVTAALLQQAIPPFHNMTLEEIKEALPDNISFGDINVSEDTVGDMNPVDKVLNEKNVTFDMLFRTKPENSCNVEIFCDIEPQSVYPLENETDPDSYNLGARAVYYICRMISIQLRYGKGYTKKYRDLKKCYGIWLCFDDLYNEKSENAGFTRYGWKQLECSPNLNGKLTREQEAMDLMEIIIVRAGGKFLNGENKDLLDLVNAIWRGNKPQISKYIPETDPESKSIYKEVSKVCTMGEIMKVNFEKLAAKQVEEAVNAQIEAANAQIEAANAQIESANAQTVNAYSMGIRSLVSTLKRFGHSDEKEIIDTICHDFDLTVDKATVYYKEYIAEQKRCDSI